MGIVFFTRKIPTFSLLTVSPAEYFFLLPLRILRPVTLTSSSSGPFRFDLNQPSSEPDDIDWNGVQLFAISAKGRFNNA